MPNTLPRNLIEPLATAIGHDFELGELDAVVFRSTGERLFKDLVGEGDPHVITAYKLLNALGELGEGKYVRLFLAHVLASRPNNADLRQLIGQACPEALTAEIETRKQVPAVLAGLVITKSMLNDPVVKQALLESRGTLAVVIRDIDILEAYKNLHECLHQLQITSFSSLRTRAKQLAADPSQGELLRGFNEQIIVAYTKARLWADKLPEGPATRGLETLWIDALEAASDRYQPALDAENARDLLGALNEVRRVIRKEPFHLNNMVYGTAKDMPLQTLTAALQGVSAVGSVPPALATAYTSMRDLQTTLLGRVREHKLWQEADNKIWELEEMFDHASDEARADFIFLWPSTKNAVMELAALDPKAKWAENTKVYMGRVDDELARGGSNKDLWEEFDAYRREARVRFFRVDAQLRADCAQLVRIGAPLREIMEKLDGE
jgi:hypothetical protein